MPNLKNSKFSKESLRSDLLRMRKTGFLDFQADLTIVWSRKSGYLVESTTKRIKSDTVMASSI